MPETTSSSSRRAFLRRALSVVGVAGLSALALVSCQPNGEAKAAAATLDTADEGKRFSHEVVGPLFSDQRFEGFTGGNGPFSEPRIRATNRVMTFDEYMSSEWPNEWIERDDNVPLLVTHYDDEAIIVASVRHPVTGEVAPLKRSEGGFFAVFQRTYPPT